jgi:hypothetical protein
VTAFWSYPSETASISAANVGARGLSSSDLKEVRCEIHNPNNRLVRSEHIFDVHVAAVLESARIEVATHCKLLKKQFRLLI